MAAPTTDPTALDGDRVDPDLLAELRRYHSTGVTRDIAWRTGQLSALERMLDEREDFIWLRIARGLDPIPTKQGDCGCEAVNAQNTIVVPVATESN